MPTASNSRIRIARGNQSNLQGQDFPAGTLFYEKDTALLKIGNGSSASAGSDHEHGDPLYTRGIASNQSGNIGGSGNRLHYTTNGALSGVFSSLSLKDTQSNAFDLTASASGSGWNASLALLSGGSASIKLSTSGTDRVEISGSAITLYPNGYGLTIANAGNTGSSTTQSNSINLQHNSSYYDCIVPANKSGHQFFKLPAHGGNISSDSSAAEIATDVSLTQNSIFGQIVLNQNGGSAATTVTGLPNNAVGEGYVLKTSTANSASWVTPPQLTSSNAGAAGSIVVNANSDISGLQHSTNVQVVGGSSIRVSDGIQFGTSSSYASLTKAANNTAAFTLPNTTASTGGTTLLAGSGFTDSGKGKVSTASDNGITIIDASALSTNNNFVKVSVSDGVVSLKEESSINLATNGDGGVTGVLKVSNGGTGSSTLPANAILLGNGSGAIGSIGTTVGSSGSAYTPSMYLLAATTSGSSISSYSWRSLTYSDIGGQEAINVSAATGTNTYYIIGRSGTSVGGIGSQLYFNTGCFISGSRITAGSYLAQSDINLKENIQDFVETKSILDVPIHRYTWKESKEEDIGFIAQELERQFPELVLGEEGHKTIKESKFVYYLMHEVKRQKARIDVLEKLIKQE